MVENISLSFPRKMMWTNEEDLDERRAMLGVFMQQALRKLVDVTSQDAVLEFVLEDSKEDVVEENQDGLQTLVLAGLDYFGAEEEHGGGEGSVLPSLVEQGMVVDVQSCETVTDAAGSHTVFVMRVAEPEGIRKGRGGKGSDGASPKQERIVKKRYRDFSTLHERLSIVITLSFPPKIIGSLTEEDVDERCAVLCVFMQQALRKLVDVTSQDAVLEFVLEDSVKEEKPEEDEGTLENFLTSLTAEEQDENTETVALPSLAQQGLVVDMVTSETIKGRGIASSHTVFVMRVVEPQGIRKGGEAECQSDSGHVTEDDDDDDDECVAMTILSIKRTVKKRYSDFHKLHGRLSTMADGKLSFPPRILGSLTEEDLDERRAMLGVFMLQALRKLLDATSQEEVLKFLAKDSDLQDMEDKGRLENLAASTIKAGLNLFGSQEREEGGEEEETMLMKARRSTMGLFGGKEDWIGDKTGALSTTGQSNELATLSQQGMLVELQSYETVTNTAGSHTVFVMRVAGPQKLQNGCSNKEVSTDSEEFLERTVKKRYRDFRSLHDRLNSMVEGIMLSFPPKMLTSPTEEDLDERQAMLGVFMQQALRKLVYANTQESVLDFCMLPSLSEQGMAVDVQSCETVTDAAGSHTVFVMCVHDPEGVQKWRRQRDGRIVAGEVEDAERIVKKRYRDFNTLHEVLSSMVVNITLSFPPKIIGSLTEQDLDVRRAVLGVFMQQALRKLVDVTTQDVVMVFLSEDSKMEDHDTEAGMGLFEAGMGLFRADEAEEGSGEGEGEDADGGGGGGGGASGGAEEAKEEEAKAEAAKEEVQEAAMEEAAKEANKTNEAKEAKEDEAAKAATVAETASEEVDEEAKGSQIESEKTSGLAVQQDPEDTGEPENLPAGGRRTTLLGELGLEGVFGVEEDSALDALPSLYERGMAVDVQSCETVTDAAGVHQVFVMRVTEPGGLRERRDGVDAEAGEEGDGSSGPLHERIVKKRHRDFNSLHGRLTSMADVTLSFPPMILGSLTEEDLDERRAMLGVFMQQALRKLVDSPTQQEVLKFLAEDSELQDEVDKGILENLAAGMDLFGAEEDDEGEEETMMISLAQQGMKVTVETSEAVTGLAGFSHNMYVMRVIDRKSSRKGDWDDDDEEIPERVVKKRNRDFRTLHDRLSAMDIVGFSFPSFIIGSLSEQELDERIAVLNTFMQQVLNRQMGSTAQKKILWFLAEDSESLNDQFGFEFFVKAGMDMLDFTFLSHAEYFVIKSIRSHLSQGFDSRMLNKNQSATVMFVNIGIDYNEPIHNVLNFQLQPAFVCLLEELYAHGGFLRQLAADDKGTVFIAVFSSSEHDALNCVKCALAMHQRMGILPICLEEQRHLRTIAGAEDENGDETEQSDGEGLEGGEEGEEKQGAAIGEVAAGAASAEGDGSSPLTKGTRRKSLRAQKAAQKKSKRIVLSTGICSGDIFCGPIGSSERCDYLLVGDTVNTAARLSGKAISLATNGILVDSRSYYRACSSIRRTDGMDHESIAWQELVPLSVKGKTERLQVYAPRAFHGVLARSAALQVIWPLPRESGSQQRSSETSKLLGRGEELRTLRRHLHQLCTSATATVLSPDSPRRAPSFVGFGEDGGGGGDKGRAKGTSLGEGRKGRRGSLGRSGAGCVVIKGDAGMGKTTLAKFACREMAQMMEEEAAENRELRGVMRRQDEKESEKHTKKPSLSSIDGGANGVADGEVSRAGEVKTREHSNDQSQVASGAIEVAVKSEVAGEDETDDEGEPRVVILCSQANRLGRHRPLHVLQPILGHCMGIGQGKDEVSVLSGGLSEAAARQVVETQLELLNMVPDVYQMGSKESTLDILLAVLQGRMGEAEAEAEAKEAEAEAKEAEAEAAEAEAAEIAAGGRDGGRAQAEAEQRIGNMILSKSPSLPRRLVRKPSIDGKTGMRGKESRADSPFLLTVCAIVTQFLQLFVSRSNRRVAMLLLILEDLHFFDPYSWHVIQALRRDRGKSGSGGRSSIVLVLTGREQEEGVSANPAANYSQLMRDPGVKVMTLGKLRGPEVLTLSQELFCVRSLSAELCVFIQAKAEGNPAWVTELCLAAQAAGVVEIRSSDGSSPAARVSSPNKPSLLQSASPSSSPASALSPAVSSTCHIRSGVDLERVQLLRQTMVGLFQGIFEHLEPTEQLTLKVAAVIGREFSLQMLYSVHPLTQGQNSNVQASMGAGSTQELVQAQESIYEDLVALMRKGIVRERSYSGGLMSIMRVRNGNGNDSLSNVSALSSTIKAERTRLRQQQQAEATAERDEREQCLQLLCIRQGFSTEGGCMHLTERLYCGLGWTPAQLEFHIDAEVEQRRLHGQEQERQRSSSVAASPNPTVRTGLALSRADSLSGRRLSTTSRPATTVEMHDDHFFFRQQSFAQAVYDMLSQAQRFQMHVNIAARYKECFEVAPESGKSAKYGRGNDAPQQGGLESAAEEEKDTEEKECALREEERVVATAQFAPLVAHHLASAGEKFQTDAADYFECSAQALLSGCWVSVLAAVDSPAAAGAEQGDEVYEEDGVLLVARSVGLKPKEWPELAARERLRKADQASADSGSHAGMNGGTGETQYVDPILAHDLALLASTSATLGGIPTTPSIISISIPRADGLSVTTLWLSAALVLRAAVSLYNAVADGTANANVRGSPPSSFVLPGVHGIAGMRNSPLDLLSSSPRSPRMIITHPEKSSAPKDGTHRRSNSGHQRKVSFSEQPTQLGRAHLLAADGMGLLRLWGRHVRRRQRWEEREQRRREKRQRSLQRSLRQQRRSIHRGTGASPGRSDGRTIASPDTAVQSSLSVSAAATAAAAAAAAVVTTSATVPTGNMLARNGGHRLGQHRPAAVGLARRSAPPISRGSRSVSSANASPPQAPQPATAARRRSSGHTLMSMLNIDSGSDSDGDADGEDTREGEDSTEEEEEDDDDDDDDDIDEDEGIVVGAECPECAHWVLTSEDLLQHCVKFHNYKDKYNYEHSDSHGGQGKWAEEAGGAGEGHVKAGGAEEGKTKQGQQTSGGEEESVAGATGNGQAEREVAAAALSSVIGEAGPLIGAAGNKTDDEGTQEEDAAAAEASSKQRLPPTAEGTAEEEGAEVQPEVGEDDEEDFFGGIRRASDMAMAAFAFSPGSEQPPEPKKIERTEEGEQEGYFSSSFSSFSFTEVFSPGADQPADGVTAGTVADTTADTGDTLAKPAAAAVAVDTAAAATPVAGETAAVTESAVKHESAENIRQKNPLRRQSAPMASVNGASTTADNMLTGRTQDDSNGGRASATASSGASGNDSRRGRRATDFVSDSAGTSDAARLMAIAQGFTGFGGSVSGDATGSRGGGSGESSHGDKFPFPIKRASVVNAAATSSFDIFKLKVERKDGRIYVLKKRFSQFETLTDAVQADALRGAKAFPAASVFDFSLGFRLSPEQLGQRRQQLHDFMQQPWAKLSDDALQRFNVFLMEGNDCAITSGRKSDARRRPSS
jgi:hypothetical protein